MKSCPKCGALAVMFSDGDRNNLGALGLRCFGRCGWKLTMKNLLDEVRSLKIQSCQQQLELAEQLIKLNKGFVFRNHSASEAVGMKKFISSLEKIKNQIADDLRMLESDSE